MKDPPPVDSMSLDTIANDKRTYLGESCVVRAHVELVIIKTVCGTGNVDYFAVAPESGPAKVVASACGLGSANERRSP
jgi:hypothetical protein